MQPKELMELAAKVVGLNYCHASGFACKPNGEAPKPWNPWENSGDAMELGVSLGMSIDINIDGIATATTSIDNQPITCSIHIDDCCDCLVVATRRAIVNAAALMACRMGLGEWRS